MQGQLPSCPVLNGVPTVPAATPPTVSTQPAAMFSVNTIGTTCADAREDERTKWTLRNKFAPSVTRHGNTPCVATSHKGITSPTKHPWVEGHRQVRTCRINGEDPVQVHVAHPVPTSSDPSRLRRLCKYALCAACNLCTCAAVECPIYTMYIISSFVLEMCSSECLPRTPHLG
jgi:hypothetical protein